MMEPEIEWLIRRFDLPDESAEHARALLRAEAEGSTAVMVPPDASWGPAAGDNGPLHVVKTDSTAFLQSHRMFHAERAIASRLLAMASGETRLPSVEEYLTALFPDAKGTQLQAEAARVAAARRLALVTGGPGTGKTYTLARILTLFLETGIPPEAIRLAAPTGKAADRMRAAVADSLNGLPPRFEARRPDLAAVAGCSSTIHQLLGYNPHANSLRYHHSARLSCAALIVDECSMADTLLWAALLDALPDDARLVLLGDPNQLESVGQGAVFSELVQEASRHDSPLQACHVHLQTSHRFKDRPDLAELALALENRDGQRVANLLKANRGHGRGDGIAWIESSGKSFPPPERYPEPILQALRALATAPDPKTALAAMPSACVLTPQRNFFVGCRAVSAALDTYFARVPGAVNRPIIVEANDPESGLRNGQTGLIHISANGQRLAWFAGTDGKPKSFALARLPEHSPAWAITIHRSQGSEYDDVLVVLPREESPLSTRELLYTAVTRARRNVYIAGDLDAAIAAALNVSGRVTLLAHHLRAC